MTTFIGQPASKSSSDTRFCPSVCEALHATRYHAHAVLRISPVLTSGNPTVCREKTCLQSIMPMAPASFIRGHKVGTRDLVT